MYDAFRERLVEIRRNAGLTQRQLAAQLCRPRSFVSRIEDGERRVDLVEFIWICRACNAAPERETLGLVKQLAALDHGARAKPHRAEKLVCRATSRRAPSGSERPGRKSSSR